MDNNNESYDKRIRWGKMIPPREGPESSRFTLYDAALVILVAVGLYLAFGK